MPEIADKLELRSMIIESLKGQGFVIDGLQLLSPVNLDKHSVRELHATAVKHRQDRSEKGLKKYEDRLLARLADGQQVNPQAISPRLVEITPDSDDELLFRYAALHWSIPISSGYGRRLRFLVIDEHNDKLMGIFGLADPVFNLGARDQWIGWDKETAMRRLRHVMDIFVLGAVPPYASLLCGKLIGLLATSDEVRQAVIRKYSDRKSLIAGTAADASLALLTTTSALGRSSIYNRLKFQERLAYMSVGFTKGYGDFHFANGLYSAISKYAAHYLKPTAKQAAWGTGFRNRREVVRKCLAHLGLSEEWLNHGVRREVFVIPLAKNTQEFLRGEQSELQEFHQPVADIFGFFRERWLIPRSRWDQRYKEWNPEQWRLWDPWSGADA